VTYVSADIQGLANPVGRNATNEDGEAIDVLGGSSTIGVDIASQTRLVVGVANEEDTLDGVECSTGELGHSINGSCSTLRISLEDEAHVGIRLQSSVHLVDDLCLSVQSLTEVEDNQGSTYISSTFSRVLINAGRVDSIVLQYNQYSSEAADSGTQTSVPPITRAMIAASIVLKLLDGP
jgi:hypothetical protein